MGDSVSSIYSLLQNNIKKNPGSLEKGIYYIYKEMQKVNLNLEI